jgi:putative transcriptional regulator
MIRHHPGDELVLALAAGRLPPAQALLVAVHLEGCTECRTQAHLMQAVGGALIEEAEPLALATDSWTRTLERIDAAATRPMAWAPAREEPPLLLPGGTPWPAGLRGCRVSGWRWMSPGRRFARVVLPYDPEAALFLLRIDEGRSLPRHTHRGVELTQVLCGSFHDGRARFGPGDFDAADEDVLHEPVVERGAECVCLAHVGGSLRFEGRIAAMIGGWIGM